MSLLGRVTQALEKLNKNIPSTNENIPSTSKLNTIEKQDESESNDDSDNSFLQQVNQIEEDIQGTDQRLEIDRLIQNTRKIVIHIEIAGMTIHTTGVEATLRIITIGQHLQTFNTKKRQYSNQVMMALLSTNGI